MNRNYMKMIFFKHNLYLEKNLSILGENWLIKESQLKIQIVFLIFFLKPSLIEVMTWFIFEQDCDE